VTLGTFVLFRRSKVILKCVSEKYLIMVTIKMKVFKSYSKDLIVQKISVNDVLKIFVLHALLKNFSSV
jgi:hypothetical protein